ncbi:hypothetical protein ARZXY2_619 [Arthrobacter sp. ZXY-2]|nr:hypothetical protein ARZXY2_619 [Arthrobacter sp. ZXY-2]
MSGNRHAPGTMQIPGACVSAIEDALGRVDSMCRPTEG